MRKADAPEQAKTNTPQTMLVAEAHNNLFGRTKNPVVSHLTPGGSSGGEGSLLAFRGSALGIGTDVGGSIRIPAAACGIYGFKPSFGLLPMLGYAASSWTGMNTGVPAVLGPLGHSVRDLNLLTTVVRGSKPWLDDPAIIPSIFETETSERAPVIGIIRKSGLTPHPPIKRALLEAADRLRQAGLQVKEFEPVSFSEISKITRQLFTVDGLSYQRRELSKVQEPPVPSVKGIGHWDIPKKTHEEMWSWSTRKLALQKEMLERWTSAGVDVVLCPAGPYTAVKPDGWTQDMYTVCWNAVDVSYKAILRISTFLFEECTCASTSWKMFKANNYDLFVWQYPAVIIPFTHVDSAKDLPYESFEPLSDDDVKVQAQCKRHAHQALACKEPSPTFSSP